MELRDASAMPEIVGGVVSLGNIDGSGVGTRVARGVAVGSASITIGVGVRVGVATGSSPKARAN